MFVSLSTWDTENDAREFFDAYAKRTQLRYPDAAEVTSNTELPTPNHRTWKTSEGLVTIELRGSRVLVVDGRPDGVGEQALEKTLWK